MRLFHSGLLALSAVVFTTFYDFTSAVVTPSRPPADQYPTGELTYDAQVLIERAEQLAWYLQNERISLAHLALCLFEGVHETIAKEAVEEAGGNFLQIRGSLKATLIRQVRTKGTLLYGECTASDTLRNAVIAAYKLADAEGTRIGLQHIHIVLLGVPSFRQFLLDAGTDLEIYKERITEAYKNRQRVKLPRSYSEYAGGGDDAKAEGFLSQYATDLTFMAGQGLLTPIIGRNEEIARIARLLGRKAAKAPMVIGESGVGKSTIVEGLAQRIVEGAVPKNMKGMRIFSLDLSALSSASNTRADFDAKLKEIVGYMKRHREDTILFIDNIDQLYHIGKSSGAVDTSVLRVPLSKGEIRLIASTSFEDYKREIEKDRIFERTFEKVVITAPTIERTINILRSVKSGYEKFHNVIIPEEVIESVVRLSDQYIKEKEFPDKALDLLDSACSLRRSRLRKGEGVCPITDSEKTRLLTSLELLSEEDVALLMTAINFLTREEKRRILDRAPLNEKQRSLLNKADEDVEFIPRYRLVDGRYVRDAVGEYIMEGGEYVEDLSIFAKDQNGKYLRNEDGKYVVDQNRVEPDDSPLELRIDDVAEVLSEITGIPLSKMTEDEKTRILRLADILAERVVGQGEAVKLISDAIIRQRAGLNPKDSPLGSFLFLGTSGVGKTELAKVLATQLFSSEKNMIRLDMSEYQEAHSISRLIGSPPGYMGNDQGGQLTEAVRQKPYSVILFDEVENAHQNIWSILLPLLEDGRLTDTRGITVDFSKTIIIMTSNIGQQFIMEGYREARSLADGKATPLATFNKNSNSLERYSRASAGADALASMKKNTSGSAVEKQQEEAWNNNGKTPREILKQMRRKVMKEVHNYFKPQVIGRITEIVIFEPLTIHSIKGVLGLKFKGLINILASKGIEFKVSDSALSYIVERAWSDRYGFRPVLKFIDKYVTAKIAPLLISEKLIKGDRAVLRVDSNNSHRLNLVICHLKDDKCVTGSTYGVALTVLPPKPPTAAGEEEDPLV